MRPGPKPICDCGGCKLCKHRPIWKAHYLRNSENLKRKAKEYYNEHKRKYIPMSDRESAELDRKCLESLRQEGFR